MDDATRLDGVEAIAREQASYRTRAPSPRLVLAFVLGRLGRLAEAEDALDAVASAGRLPDGASGESVRNLVQQAGIR